MRTKMYVRNIDNLQRHFIGVFSVAAIRKKCEGSCFRYELDEMEEKLLSSGKATLVGSPGEYFDVGSYFEFEAIPPVVTDSMKYSRTYARFSMPIPRDAYERMNRKDRKAIRQEIKALAPEDLDFTEFDDSGYGDCHFYCRISAEADFPEFRALVEELVLERIPAATPAPR